MALPKRFIDYLRGQLGDDPERRYAKLDEDQRFAWAMSAGQSGIFDDESNVGLNDLDISPQAFGNQFLTEGAGQSGGRSLGRVYSSDALVNTIDALDLLKIKASDRVRAEGFIHRSQETSLGGQPVKGQRQMTPTYRHVADTGKDQDLWSMLENIPGSIGSKAIVSVLAPPAGMKGRTVQISTPSGHNIYRHVEPMPGNSGYRIGNRLVQGTFEGGEGGAYTSAETVLTELFQLAAQRAKGRTQKGSYEEIRRPVSAALLQGGTLRLGSGMSRRVPGLQTFPGIPEAYEERYSPQLQTRLALAGQVMTDKPRDPGLWQEEMRYAKEQSYLGQMVSRGSETRQDAETLGRFGAFPTSAFGATPEMMAGTAVVKGVATPFFLHGFGMREPPAAAGSGFMRGVDPGGTAKSAKRLQMGTMEQYFMKEEMPGRPPRPSQFGVPARPGTPARSRPIIESPFRYREVKLPSGKMYQPPRERGQLVKAAIMMSGLMPEGMAIASATANLPPTYERRVIHTPMKVDDSGRTTAPVPAALGTSTLNPRGGAAGRTRYGQLTLGHTAEGRPIRWDSGDFLNAHIVGNEVYELGGGPNDPGVQTLKTTVEQLRPTGVNTKMMAGGIKALETVGKLPPELEAEGVEFMYPMWKNMMGASHHLLWAAQASMKPEEFESLLSQHGVTYEDLEQGKPGVGAEWYASSEKHAKGIISAAQEFARQHTDTRSVSWTIEQAKLPAYQLEVDPENPNQLIQTDQAIGELVKGSSSYDADSKTWSMKLKRDMYVGPWIRQARMEHQGGSPFTSFEELQQISKISGYAGVAKGSLGFAKTLRGESSVMRDRPQYEKMLQAWESQQLGRLPKSAQIPKIEPGSKEADTVWSQVDSRWEAYKSSAEVPIKEDYWENSKWFDILSDTVGNRMLGVPLGGKKVGYLPPPGVASTFGATDPFGEEVSSLMRYYRQVAKELQAVDSGDMSGAEAKEANLPKKWKSLKNEWQELVNQPQYQRQLIGARVKYGFEGTYAASQALPGRAAVYGSEALAEMAGMQPGKINSRKLADFESYVEQRHGSKEGPLLALVARRPVSDPKGQWGMAVAEVWTENMAREMKVPLGDIAKGEAGLGRSAIISPELGAVGRGDFDADRFISMLLYNQVSYKPGRESKTRSIKDPLWSEPTDIAYNRGKKPLTGTGGLAGKFVPRGVSNLLGVKGGQRTATTADHAHYVPGEWSVSTPKWARQIAGQDLMSKISGRLGELTGRGKGAHAFDANIFANEMGKWTKEQTKQLGGKGSTRQAMMHNPNMWWSMMAEASGHDIQKTYVDEMLNKQIGMTVPYNIGRSLEMIGADPEGTMAFTAMAYQYGIDRKLQLEPQFDESTGQKLKYVEGLKTIMDMYQTWKPGSGAATKGRMSGFFNKLQPYGMQKDWSGKAMTQKFGPDWEKMPATPDAYVSKMVQAVVNLTTAPEGEGRGLTYEHAGRLLGAVEGEELNQVIQAMQTGKESHRAYNVKRALGGAKGVLGRAGLPRAIAARRLARYADDPNTLWAPGSWEKWSGVTDLEGMVSQGRDVLRTTGFLSRNTEGAGDILGALWNMPYTDAYSWLPQDILGRVGAPQEDPINFFGSMQGGGLPKFYSAHKFGVGGGGRMSEWKREIEKQTGTPIELKEGDEGGYAYLHGTDTVLEGEEAAAVVDWMQNPDPDAVAGPVAGILNRASQKLMEGAKKGGGHEVTTGTASAEASATGTPPSPGPNVLNRPPTKQHEPRQVRASQLGASYDQMVINEMQKLGYLPGETVEGLVGTGGHKEAAAYGEYAKGKHASLASVKFEEPGSRMITLPSGEVAELTGTGDLVNPTVQTRDYKTGKPDPRGENQRYWQAAAYNLIYGTPETKFQHMPQSKEGQATLTAAREYVRGAGIASQGDIEADPRAGEHMRKVARALIREGEVSEAYPAVGEEKIAKQVERHLRERTSAQAEARALGRYAPGQGTGVTQYGNLYAGLEQARAGEAAANPMMGSLTRLFERYFGGGETGGGPTSGQIARSVSSQRQGSPESLAPVYEMAAEAAMAGLPTAKSLERISEFGQLFGTTESKRLRKMGGTIQELRGGKEVTRSTAQSLLSDITASRRFLEGYEHVDLDPKMQELEGQLNQFLSGGERVSMFSGGDSPEAFKGLEKRGEELMSSLSDMQGTTQDVTSTFKKMNDLADEAAKQFPNMTAKVTGLTNAMEGARESFEAGQGIARDYAKALTQKGGAERHLAAMQKSLRRGPLSEGQLGALGDIQTGLAMAGELGGVGRVREMAQEVARGQQRVTGREGAGELAKRMGGGAGRGGGGIFDTIFGSAQEGKSDQYGPAGRGIAGGIGQMYRRYFSGWELMRMQRMWQMTGAPAFQQYIPAAGQAGMSHWAMAQQMGTGMPVTPQGVAGGLMQYGVQRQLSQVQAGRAAYGAWGWTQEPQGWWDQALGLAGPALGAGAVGGNIIGIAAYGMGGEKMGLNKAMGSWGVGAGLAITGGAAIAAASQWAGAAIGDPYSARAMYEQGTIPGDNQIEKLRYTMGAFLHPQDAATRAKQLGVEWEVGPGAGSFIGKRTDEIMAEIDALPSTGIVKAIERIGGYEQALVEGLGNFQNWRREVGEPQEERLAAAEVAKYERLKDTPFSKMAREDQALMLGMTIEDLQEQGGGFSFRELEQLGPLVAGAEGYLPVMGLTPTQWKAGGGDIAELEEWAIRGYGAERYRDVSESLGMGRRFSLDISRRIGRMAEPDQERRLQAMQQRAGRLRFGVSQQEILEKTMPHGGGPAQWGKLTGPQGQQAVMAEGVAAQAAQLMGVPMFSQESRALMEWLDTQPVDIQEQFAMAMPAAAQVGQAKGVDQLAMRSIGLRYSRALQRPGVTTQAVGLAAQIDLGQGAVWSALGGLPGMGQQFERPMMQALLGEQGQLNTQQYGQMAGMMQFGRGQMGYSMMAGAFGIGRQLRGAFGQTPLGMPFGEALIDAQGYSVGQLEGRDLRRGFQLAGFGRQFEQFGEQRAGLGLQVRQQAEAETYQLAGMTLQRAQAVTMRSFTIELQGLADNMKSVNRDFQELQWDFAIESRQLARGQQADTMALQRRGQLADVSYQRQMMGFQRGQQLTQQGWRQEDVAWGRGMAGFQYEYQMGELERGMRLSGGQEREQLWRRREYMEETYARQESRRGVEEGRLGQQMDWENQLFVMQSTHFEQQVSRQDQQYQMTLSHLMERYSLEDEQFQAQMSHTREVWVLQDQMTAKQREAEAARYEFQLSEIDRTRAYYEDHVFPFQKERLGLQEQAITNAETYYKDTVIPYQNEMFDNQVRIETAHANYTEWQMGIYVEGGDLWNAVELLTRHWLGEFSGALDAYEPPAWLSGGQLVPDPKGDSEGAVSSGGSGDPLRTFLPIMIQSIIVRIGGQDFAATVEGIVDEYGNFHSQAEGWGDVY